MQLYNRTPTLAQTLCRVAVPTATPFNVGQSGLPLRWGLSGGSHEILDRFVIVNPATHIGNGPVQVGTHRNGESRNCVSGS
jgi:hypothetical protein